MHVYVKKTSRVPYGSYSRWLPADQPGVGHTEQLHVDAEPGGHGRVQRSHHPLHAASPGEDVTVHLE